MPKKTFKKTKSNQQAAKDELEEPRNKAAQLHLLKGMKDILPDDQDYWNFIYDKVRELGHDYGYGQIATPILEPTNLFIRTVGKETDIVEKEVYSFIDKGEEDVTLRPENTASVARAYIEHGFVAKSQPVKLFYYGPFFRYNRPQSGRYRQFFQFGYEALGEDHPVIDAQLIALAHKFFQEIGLKVSLQVNSIGCPACRENYLQVLVNYFRSKRKNLCDDCKRRLTKNPLRLLDCKEAGCAEVAQDAPQIVDYLCEECRDHFVRVLEYLDSMEITYNLNPQLVRGLDYYTRTTFEIWPDSGETASQSSLGGGGRYDNLIELIGGRPTPAAGFACGIERIIIQLKEKAIDIPRTKKPEIFIAQLGVTARKECIKLFEQFRKEGIKAGEDFAKDSIKDQLSRASRLGVKLAIILGQKEILDGTVLIRDMENGIQEVVDINKVVQEVQKRLAKLNEIDSPDQPIS
ncbi:histidine--tRNA ligase [Patescibacteria group bacterium]|nr:histidine--tRNA ligase [Patescibacteria group bacterium]